MWNEKKAEEVEEKKKVSPGQVGAVARLYSISEQHE